MKKNVWILNHYATGMFFNKGGRHYWFAKYLKREGYEPVIFCCNAKHGKLENYFDSDQLWIEKIAEDIAVPFVAVKSSLYKSNGKARIINMVHFYRNVQKAAKEYAKTHPKPDVIYASSVHPLTLVAGIKLAKFFGIKCICEIRDLWPLSLVDYGFIGEDSLLTKGLYRGERWIYKNADAIVFTAGGFNDYIAERGWQNDVPKTKVHYINNGIDLEIFDYNKKHFIIKDDDLNNDSLFKVIYTGSIRKVNDLNKLVDVATLVKNPIIRFLIWGDGNELQKLNERIINENIKNVIFKGRVEKKYVPYIVSKADLNIAHGRGAPLLRFGISGNKIFDYLAAGKPVLCDIKANYNPIVLFNAGLTVDSGDSGDIAAAVDCFSTMNEEQLLNYGKNARKAAMEFDFKTLTKEIVSVINSLYY